MFFNWKKTPGVSFSVELKVERTSIAQRCFLLRMAWYFIFNLLKDANYFFFSEPLENNLLTLKTSLATKTSDNGSGFDDMPTWMVLPDLDIKSILGSDHESEVDELALDDHGESVYSLEQHPLTPIRINKRKRSPHSRRPSIHDDTFFGESSTPKKKIRLSDEHRSTPLAASSHPEDTLPTSNDFKSFLDGIHGPIVASSVDRSPNHLFSSSSTFLNKGGTLRILDNSTARIREANKPHVKAGITDVKGVEGADTGCFEPDLDELEIRTQASVASIVFGKAAYSQKLGLEEMEACQRMSIKTVKEEMHKKSVASALGGFTPVPDIPRAVAIPHLSLSLRCDKIIEEILGSFSWDTDSSETWQSVSFVTLQYTFKLTIS